MTLKKILLLYTVLLFLVSCTSPGEKHINDPDDTVVNTRDTINTAIEAPSASATTQDSVEYLFDIAGDYILESDHTSCKMELNINSNKNQFNYRLKTNTKQLQGDVIITPNEKQDGYYITLKDIEWSEYEGAVNFDEEEVKEQEDIALPQEVQGVLYENEITIQNTGNAMNYYVKFGDCDLKYIHLVKKGKAN
ncbi:hypothetical protein U0035_02250 [Niabella yanshanensis]|uniref:Lipoprotein n=1 Tax=Niabella yanshanensis TaxID=577386 RepID=A0ABZ0WA67_9BACT|nr:hypothetical protein [Niabella yanshanensis]WQD38966.1 hypothetical protein U0035_02250 [Niabella yanshanensis]